MRILLLCLVFGLFNCQLFAQIMTDASEDADSLMAVFTEKMYEWQAAYNGGDAAALFPLYAPNAEYISGHVNGLVAAGRERLIEYLQDGIKATQRFSVGWTMMPGVPAIVMYRGMFFLFNRCAAAFQILGPIRESLFQQNHFIDFNMIFGLNLIKIEAAGDLSSGGIATIPGNRV